MSKENAARRNRALRKIRASKHLPPGIKLAIEAICDFLSPKSDYNLAWPSVNTIAARIGRSRRTGQWYVRAIKALDIFKCFQLSPDEARDYVRQRYGFQLKLDRRMSHGPHFFEVSPQHAVWDSQKHLPEDLDKQMGDIVRTVLAKRNLKTTSRLASMPIKRLNDRCLQANGRRRNGYCLDSIRTRLQLMLDFEEF